MTSRALLLFCFIALAGCDYRNEKVPTSGVSTLKRGVGFSEVREKVFGPHCEECHQSRSPVLTDYASVKKSLDEIRRSALVDKTMPKSPRPALPVEAQAILLTWLEAGAPEGEPVAEEPEEGEGKAPEIVRWADVSQAVFRKSCNECHFTGNQAGREPLDNAEAVRNSVGSVLGLSVMGQMPPEGSRPLTKAQKLLLSRWIIDGMLD